MSDYFSRILTKHKYLNNKKKTKSKKNSPLPFSNALNNENSTNKISINNINVRTNNLNLTTGNMNFSFIKGEKSAQINPKKIFNKNIINNLRDQFNEITNSDNNHNINNKLSNNKKVNKKISNSSSSKANNYFDSESDYFETENISLESFEVSHNKTKSHTNFLNQPNIPKLNFNAKIKKINLKNFNFDNRLSLNKIQKSSLKKNLAGLTFDTSNEKCIGINKVLSISPSITRINTIDLKKRELEKLKKENQALKRENERLNKAILIFNEAIQLQNKNLEESLKKLNEKEKTKILRFYENNSNRSEALLKENKTLKQLIFKIFAALNLIDNEESKQRKKICTICSNLLKENSMLRTISNFHPNLPNFDKFDDNSSIQSIVEGSSNNSPKMKEINIHFEEDITMKKRKQHKTLLLAPFYSGQFGNSNLYLKKTKKNEMINRLNLTLVNSKDLNQNTEPNKTGMNKTIIRNNKQLSFVKLNYLKLKK